MAFPSADASCDGRLSHELSLTPTPPALLDAIRLILRPLVRLMIARGIGLPALVAALKPVFVEVAERDFRIDGRAVSDSRVSVLTGLHRKDVRAIRDTAAPLSQPRSPSLGATVVGRWLGDPAFHDAAGRPRPLARQGAGGFDALVAAVSTDVRPRTVLDELARLGIVGIDEAADTIALNAEAFVPGQADPELLRFLQHNLHDHLAAAAANLLAEAGERRLLERAVFYNNLRAADVDRIEAEARTLALAALRHLNGLALDLQQAGRDDPAPKERFRFGVFFWRAPTADAPPADPLPTKDPPP
jgi:hypothetical protein